MKLTEQQINHFKTFGFLVFRQLLTPEEVQLYSDEFDTGMDATIEGGLHDGINRHWSPLMDANTPFITSLLTILGSLMWRNSYSSRRSWARSPMATIT